jgi:hypothetical protein
LAFSVPRHWIFRRSSGLARLHEPEFVLEFVNPILDRFHRFPGSLHARELLFLLLQLFLDSENLG